MSARPPKKRPPSKGPKKRAGGNHGNGQRTRFPKGQNSHTGEVFRRGPDQIPRGSVTLMLKTILHDQRETLYKNLAELCETPAGALKFAELAADRIEGKPTQRHTHQVARQTTFQRDPNAPKPGELLAAQAPAEGVLIGDNGEVLVPVRAGS